MQKTRGALLLLALAGIAPGAPSAMAEPPSDAMTEGKLAVDLGDLTAAETAFAGLAADPAAGERIRAEAHVRLGVVRRALGKTRASAAAFQEAIESPARDANVTRLLALALAGVAPDRASWASDWRKVRFNPRSGAGALQTVEWPVPRPQGVREAFPTQDLVTFDLEDVPLNTFLHHFLVEWRPGVPSNRSWPSPQASPGFEKWPELYAPPAAVQRLDFVIHSGVQGRLAEGSSDAPGARVTVKVSGMPWNELFENVLASHGLGFAIDKGLLYIARAEDLGAFEHIRRRTYTGVPISLNFLDGRLLDAFGLFADITGFQILPDEALQGRFTTVVTERPAMEVLDLLLAANDLAASRIDAPEGNPETTSLRIRRLAEVGGDMIDLSELRPARGLGGAPPRGFSTDQGRFVSMEGAVQVKRAETHEWIPARLTMRLDPGDHVRTGSDGRAEIRWDDGIALHLRPDSLVTISESTPNLVITNHPANRPKE